MFSCLALDCPHMYADATSRNPYHEHDQHWPNPNMMALVHQPKLWNTCGPGRFFHVRSETYNHLLSISTNNRVKTVRTPFQHFLLLSSSFPHSRSSTSRATCCQSSSSQNLHRPCSHSSWESGVMLVRLVRGFQLPNMSWRACFSRQ